MDEYDLLFCRADNSRHETIDGVHARLRSLGIKQADYYTQTFARKDLLTQEPIPFKNTEQYFATNFVHRNNMKKWYVANPAEAKELSIKLLKARIKHKALKRLPSEVELISSGLPSSQYYYQFIRSEVESQGLVPPYDYSRATIHIPVGAPEIIVDTREQSPLNIKGATLTKRGLNFGDYAIAGQENGLVIERKSLADLLASCVAQYGRFRREFERAREAGAYLVVLCEEELNSAMYYTRIPYLRRYSKVPPEVVFHNIRELMQDFECQFVFCNGRVRAAEVALKLLKLGREASKIDIQFYLDRAKLL